MAKSFGLKMAYDKIDGQDLINPRDYLESAEERNYIYRLTPSFLPAIPASNFSYSEI